MPLHAIQGFSHYSTTQISNLTLYLQGKQKVGTSSYKNAKIIE